MKQKKLSFTKIIDKLTDFVGGWIFFVMVAILAINVFSYWTTGKRYGSWEELSRAIMVWVAFISLGWHYREKQCVQVDIVHQYLPPHGKKILEVLVDLCSLIIGAIIFYFSVKLMLASTDKLTGVLRISYVWIDFGVVFGFGSLLYNIVRKYIPYGRDNGEKEENGQ